MAARFYAITREEMDRFLTSLGFVPVAIKGVVEFVYGKIVRIGDHRLSLRVYTAVNPTGESREKGTDAIRVQLFHRARTETGEQVVPVGRSQKCLRITTWQQNLRKAIDRYAVPDNFRLCPACGHPMVLRENSQTGEDFWGCSLYRTTGCRGKRVGVGREPISRCPAVI